MLDDFYNLPEPAFLSEAEIEKQLEPLTVKLSDTGGNTHVITASVGIWEWFLILTQSLFFPEEVVESVLSWQEKYEPGQDIGSVFTTFISSIVNHEKIIHDILIKKYQDADGHRYYDRLTGLHDRINNKLAYPVAAYPADPELLYERP